MGRFPMPRSRFRFRQADISRAVRGVLRAGLAVERVEIEHDGKIVIHSARSDSEERIATALDQWRTSRARQAERHQHG